MTLIKRWAAQGLWTAVLTREEYGLHFSVGALGRPPSDDEIDAAFMGFENGEWVEEERHLTEITSYRQEYGDQVNPWVRQFVPDAEAARWKAMVEEKRAGRAQEAQG